jgi:hypothetical protein
MENNSLNLVLLIIVSFLLGTQMSFAQQSTVGVTGRVVNERGEPVSGATVTLYYPPCRHCTDHILPDTYSLPDGLFYIRHSTRSLKGLKLFIAEPIPRGFFSPFHGAPFDGLSHFEQFRGIPVRPTKRRMRVDLGDVLLRIRYSKITLELSRVLGKSFRAFQDSGSLHMVLRDDRKRVAYDDLLPGPAFDSQLSSLNLALIRGRWTMEFSVGDKRSGARIPPVTVNVP